MFYYIEGVVSLIDGTVAVVDCGGVGYAVNTTVNSLSRVRIGEKARFYTCTIIREDCFDIYGFATAEEKRCFELLIGVSGVGAKAAQAILSANTPESLSLAIMSGNEKALTAAPGIGKKIAQRVIMELKDKFSGGAVGDSSFRFFRRLCARGGIRRRQALRCGGGARRARLRRKRDRRSAQGTGYSESVRRGYRTAGAEETDEVKGGGAAWRSAFRMRSRKNELITRIPSALPEDAGEGSLRPRYLNEYRAGARKGKPPHFHSGGKDARGSA